MFAHTSSHDLGQFRPSRNVTGGATLVIMQMTAVQGEVWLPSFMGATVVRKVL